MKLGSSQCEGCGDFARLVKHHWYEYDTPGIRRTKNICQKCNTGLKTGHFDSLVNHFLPCWDIQLERLKNVRRGILRRLIREFPEEVWWLKAGAFNPYCQVDSYVLQD